MLYINYGPIFFTWYISPFCPDKLPPNTIPLKRFLAMAVSLRTCCPHNILYTYTRCYDAQTFAISFLD